MNFINLLDNIKYATKQEQQKELWDVEGIIKNRYNQSFKFDLRPLKNNAKGGSFKTKADKIVYDMKNQYIILDVEELHNYLKENLATVVKIEDLISKLEWNIILPK
jgi:hypothetical protein